jgi:hypothetical protein
VINLEKLSIARRSLSRDDRSIDRRLGEGRCVGVEGSAQAVWKSSIWSAPARTGNGFGGDVRSERWWENELAAWRVGSRG